MTRSSIILIGKNRRITLDELYSLSRGEAKLEMIMHSNNNSSGEGGGDDEAGNTKSNKTKNESAVAVVAVDEEDRSSSLLVIIAALKDLALNTNSTTMRATDTAATAAAATTTTTKQGRGGDELLSEGATIASLALLALTLSQERVIRGNCAIQLASTLVDLVNSILYLREEGGGHGIRLPANGTSFAVSVNALLKSKGVIAVEDKPYLGRWILLARVSLMLAQGKSSRSLILLLLSATLYLFI